MFRILSPIKLCIGPRPKARPRLGLGNMRSFGCMIMFMMRLDRHGSFHELSSVEGCIHNLLFLILVIFSGMMPLSN